MIEEFPPAVAASPETRLVLRPNRALTARQLTSVFGVLAFSMCAIALFSYSQGNAFAPAFALLHAAFVGLALRLAWRRGDRREEIAVSERAVEVRRSTEPVPAFSAHPCWVRLSVDERRGETRVLLGVSGRRVEVGSFLAQDERRCLAQRLDGLLAAASGRGLGKVG
ncbi:MAG: DUF2244 domain-containing protein [Rehaibacterium terrae]|uniref:DUF2244 domain-containing protein n=1 Tax=Rehaibacterium terrae TaxID=1341696 RepID=UPI0039192DD9